MILTNGVTSLAGGDQAEIANGGSAIFTFTITNAGEYVIEALVDAPADNCNSFYANVDYEPEGTDMTWDLAITKGFEKRMLSWRGDGSPFTPEFAPKRFTLMPGTHKVIIVGRESEVLLKSLTIRPAP